MAAYPVICNIMETIMKLKPEELFVLLKFYIQEPIQLRAAEMTVLIRAGLLERVGVIFQINEKGREYVESITASN